MAQQTKDNLENLASCNRGLIFAHHSSLPKMLSGANAFEISDIQDDETEASLIR